MESPFEGFSRRGIHGHRWNVFIKELVAKIRHDHVPNGAASLAYYLMLALFPALIFLLSLLPYLQIPALERAMTDFMAEALPRDAASLLTRTLQGVLASKEGGLLSLGALLTLWAASRGMLSVMQQLNLTYDVRETRSFWKTRALALLLTVIFGALVIVSFILIVVGGMTQAWLGRRLGFSPPLIVFFATVRWVIIASALLLAFAVTYCWGPDVDQKFRFITPGSLIGVLLLVVASVGFRAYVERFGNYNATYGSLGAVVILMLWLYITGLVLLVGSEVNALIESLSPDGKRRGERIPAVRAA